MKQRLKRLAEAAAPRAVAAFRALSTRRYFRRQFQVLQAEVRERLFSGSGIAVLSGPFKGMLYIDGTVWGLIAGRWLGSYEEELHGIVEEIVSAGYPVIVDVGCAEGYYAVGLAWRIPSCRVEAYDTDFISRRQARCLAALNGVADRVDVRRYCSHADLGRLRGSRVLVVCDIEGYERGLLDPDACPALQGFDLLVEVHAHFGKPGEPDNDELLTRRFAATHAIATVEARDRSGWIERACGADPLLARNRGILAGAADEHRADGRTWLWMKCRRPA